MSDENKEKAKYVGEMILIKMKSLEKKIAELEDRLQKCGVKWDFRLDELNGKVEELEQKLTDLGKYLGFNRYEDINGLGKLKTTVESFELYKKEIAELSKRMGDIFINQKVFFIKEIDELQTKQQLITEELQNLNIWRRKHLGKYNALKEVLRECFDRFPSYNGIDIPREHLKKIDDWRTSMQILLKKLSGEQSEDDLTPGTARASSTDSKPESCQTCLYENNMKDDNTCGMCNPNTPQSHWTPKKKRAEVKER